MHVSLHDSDGLVLVAEFEAPHFTVSLSGELDASNCGTLEILDELDLDAVLLVTIDLHGLSFADGAAVRSLCDFADARSREGRMVSIVGASHTTRRVCSLLGGAKHLDPPAEPPP